MTRKEQNRLLLQTLFAVDEVIWPWLSLKSYNLDPVWGHLPLTLLFQCLKPPVPAQSPRPRSIYSQSGTSGRTTKVQPMSLLADPNESLITYSIVYWEKHKVLLAKIKVSKSMVLTWNLLMFLIFVIGVHSWWIT